MSIITLKEVTKTYKKGFRGIPFKAVDKLCVSVEENRITGFVGPNGAGKTTTIKMVMGLVKPDEGSIKIRNTDASLPLSRSKVAYVSEQPYLYRHLSVKETLCFFSRLIGLEKSKIQREVGRVLEIVELTGKEKMRIKDMSKGMQQRLNMACGLLGDPDLFILDEPMSGLDPPARRLFRNLFLELGRAGKTIFFSTHILEDIETVCEDVVVVDKGTLRYSGEVVTLLEKGYIGTELTISSIADELVEILKDRNWSVTCNPDGSYRIFLSEETELMECQNVLYQHGVFCSSVVRRTMPLENLLYDNIVENKIYESPVYCST